MSTTDSLSPVFANSYISQNQQKALVSEAQTLNALLAKNHQLLYHRKKFCNIEIDLITHDSDGIIQFIEVKTYSSPHMIQYRLTKRQKQRLVFAKTFFESTYHLPTQLLLALVHNNEVELHIIA